MQSANDMTKIIRLLAAEKRVSINKMLLDCALGKSLIVDIERTGSYPTADKLQKIADYFDVSIDYLLSRRSDSTLPEPTAQIIKIGQGGELITFDIPPKQVPLAKKLLEVLAEDDV